MIIKLAQLAREKGSKAFFYTQLESGSEVFSYRQTHLAAAALAQELEKKALARTRAILHATCSTDPNSCSSPLLSLIWGQRLPC